MVLFYNLINRYHELKQEVPDCIWLIQVGAFMQVLDDDVQVVSEVTHLKLQLVGAI